MRRVAKKAATPPPVRKDGLKIAAIRAREGGTPTPRFEIKPPELPPGVVPKGRTAPVMAMDGDGGWGASCAFGGGFYYGAYSIAGFPGYQYLAGLSTRAEYRAFASALSTEMTREWITLNSSETDDDATKDKLTQIAKRLEDLGVQQVIQKACELDAYFGHSQIFIDLGINGREAPLILSPKTIVKGLLKRFTVIEPMWTTPNAYNAADPTAPDFYRPTSWFVLGKIIHSSRLLDIQTRPLPDMLKPAFNFGGMSLSQLAEPYVNNWLRTRQSVSDLLNNFSITALATDMSQVLTEGNDGSQLFDRADLFTATRSNRGLMLLDKEREELVQVNTPLSGLDELQAQAQEHMCSVSRIPAMILTGISPSGLNASSEGEIRAFYDWISAQQESYYRKVIDTMIKVIQLDMFGEIDPDITFTFDPLYQMTPKELAEIRKADSDAAAVFIDRGVIDPQEERERLARDPQSNYQGLDLSKEIVDVNIVAQDAGFAEGCGNISLDAAFSESDHPRDEGGKFAESEKVANSLGYKIVKHDSENSYSKSPGYKKGTAGYADVSRKEIHLSTEGKSKAYADHYLHHEVGHVVDYHLRNTDSFGKDKVSSHENYKELKQISKVFETDYNFKSAATKKFYQNSTNEVMAEAFAIYQENPERLKSMAPTVYSNIKKFMDGV